MKRNTDVSRLRPAAVQGSAETGTRPSSCDAAIERAAELLVHALRHSDPPISQLSDALARMARTLTDMGTPLFDAAAAKSSRDARALRDAFAGDLAVCIESLQFHDRLMQQLTQARDVLTAAAGNPLLVAGPANEGSITGSVELF